jgi:hypothetical protein
MVLWCSDRRLLAIKSGWYSSDADGDKGYFANYGKKAEFQT